MTAKEIELFKGFSNQKSFYSKVRSEIYLQLIINGIDESKTTFRYRGYRLMLFTTFNEEKTETTFTVYPCINENGLMAKFTDKTYNFDYSNSLELGALEL